MSIMKGATLYLLKENKTQSSIIPTQLIFHTAVDQPGTTNLPKYFDRADIGVESHFWMPLDGEIVQMMDTEVRADANRYANRRADGTGAISIETEDEGDPEGIPWTDAQIASLIEIAKWANEEHGIPLEPCSSPSSPGLGYHSMWGAPSDWTPSAGKTCPGSTRINQFWDVIIPKLQEEHKTMNETEALAFAKVLYSAIVHRTGDSGGLEYWGKAFVGMTKVDALIRFIEVAAVEAGGLRTQLNVLTAEVARLKRTTSTTVASVTAEPVDVNAVADQVANILAARLAE